MCVHYTETSVSCSRNDTVSREVYSRNNRKQNEISYKHQIGVFIVRFVKSMYKQIAVHTIVYIYKINPPDKLNFQIS